MTQKVFIFSSDGNDLISVQDYDADFVSNLNAESIPNKIIDISDDQYYYGNYSTGSIRSVNDHPIIEEVVIETIVNKEILAQYPVHTQLNIIADMLEKAGIPQTAEFTAMRDFIKSKVQNHNDSIAVYSANTDTYSWVPKPTIPTE